MKKITLIQVNDNESYWEFIRNLRNNDLVNHGFIGYAGTYKGNEEEIEVQICQTAAEELSKKISSYQNFVVSGIEVDIDKDSFSVSVSL